MRGARTPKEALFAQLSLEEKERSGAEARRLYRIEEEARLAADRLIALHRQGKEQSLSQFSDFLPREEDAADFHMALFRHLEAAGLCIDAADLLPKEKQAVPGERIAYLKNRFTEQAYEMFAPRLSSPTVSYCAAFAESARTVGEGGADLCILPWRDADGVALHTFFRLVEQYDLSIRALCRVPDDGDGFMEYVLAGEGIAIPQKEDLYLALILPSRKEHGFEKLLSYCRKIGARAVYTEGYPDRHTGGTVWRVTLDLARKTLPFFLLYLFLYDTDAEIFGIMEAPPTLSSDMKEEEKS